MAGHAVQVWGEKAKTPCLVVSTGSGEKRLAGRVRARCRQQSSWNAAAVAAAKLKNTIAASSPLHCNFHGLVLGPDITYSSARRCGPFAAWLCGEWRVYAPPQQTAASSYSFLSFLFPTHSSVQFQFVCTPPHATMLAAAGIVLGRLKPCT